MPRKLHDEGDARRSGRGFGSCSEKGTVRQGHAARGGEAGSPRARPKPTSRVCDRREETQHTLGAWPQSQPRALDHTQCAERAGVELGEVVAGDVLHHPAAAARALARSEHHLEPKHAVAGSAKTQAARADLAGRKDAAHGRPGARRIERGLPARAFRERAQLRDRGAREHVGHTLVAVQQIHARKARRREDDVGTAWRIAEPELAPAATNHGREATRPENPHHPRERRAVPRRERDADLRAGQARESSRLMLGHALCPCGIAQGTQIGGRHHASKRTRS